MCVKIRALALVGRKDPRRALGLLDDSWKRNSQLLAASESAIRKPAAEIARFATGLAMDSRNHPAVLAWAERGAMTAARQDITAIGFLKETAIRLVMAGAKAEGNAVLSIIESRILPGFAADSPTRRKESATLERLKQLCAKGSAIRDDEWFVGEMPELRDSATARALFGADLRFAARDSVGAARAYGDVLRAGGLDKETEGCATLQLARSLAALGEYDEGLRVYRRFEDTLARTKSAAPALLRAGTLCGGPLHDSRRARGFFAMVSARYPASPEAELCDWYTARILLWEKDRRASRAAFDDFERKYPRSPFIQTLSQSIRPQL